MDIGKVNVSMTIKELNRYRALEMRDTARPFVREKLKTVDTYLDRCPVCGKIVDKNGTFCSKCGQRIDMDNIAF